MPLVPRVIGLFRALLGRGRLERDLDEELRGYLEDLVSRHEQAGLAPEAARRAALADIEGIAQVKEAVRDRRVGHAVETLMQDLAYAWRTLRRAPAFAAVVILTVALGTGASIATFSVLRAVLWRTLPYPDAERLVLIDVEVRGVANAGAAPGEVRDLRARSHFLERLATIVGVDASLSIDGELERVPAASVTDDLLPLLGATPLALGRSLDARQDDVGNGVRAIVISDRLWRRGFRGDPAVIGRHVQVNNLDVQVVGVLRPDFRLFLPPSANATEDVDVWFPAGLEPSRQYRGWPIVGRLKAGASLQQAEAELDALAASFVREQPGAYPGGAPSFSLQPLREALTREVRPALVALGIAVVFVLLVACVNVANVTLARGKARERELSVRRALGAGRPRLVRQLVTESVLLAGIGSLGGLLIGYAGVALLDWLRPVHLPRQSQVAIDGGVVAFALVLSVGTGLVFGLVPAWRLTSGREDAVVRGTRSETANPGLRRLQRGLVVSEVALSIVPLLAAGLMLRSFVNLTHAPIGFDPTGLLTANIDISFRAFPDVATRWPLHREAMARVRELSGVDAVSAASPLPFAPMQIMRRYGRGEDGDEPRSLATQQTIMPGYLRLAGVQLRQGRDFTDQDISSGRNVAIVDERLARQLWPQGAVGRRLAIQIGRRVQRLEVVGVTSAVRVTRVRDEGLPHVFVPYHIYPIVMSLLVRTDLSAAALGPAIKRTVEALGTGRPVFDIRPMQAYVDESIDDTRFTMLVLTGFAGLALLLAAIGLYGTLAYLTAQRTREFGVRMALGASAGKVVQSVMAEGAVLTVTGAACGLVGALGVTTGIRHLLYDVTPFDGVTLVAMGGLVALVACVAACRPAWRAAHVDPTVALRSE